MAEIEAVNKPSQFERCSPPTDRVVRTLELLAIEPARGRTLTELARELDANTSTVANILRQLVSAGWLRRERRLHYLGPRLTGIGRAAQDAAAATMPDQGLSELADEIGMPVTCSALVRDAVILVTGAVPRDSGAPSIPVGLRSPFAPPAGSIFAAFDSDHGSRWLRRAERWRPEDRSALAEVIGEIKSRGYGVERITQTGLHLRTLIERLGPEVLSPRYFDWLTELLPDLFPLHYTLAELEGSEQLLPVSLIAAPVLDDRGAVMMSLSVHAMRSLSPAEITAMGSRLMEAAALIASTVAARAARA